MNALTLASIRTEVRTRLGWDPAGGGVEVELTDAHINSALAQTVRRYNTHLGIVSIGTLTVNGTAPATAIRAVTAGASFSTALPSGPGLAYSGFVGVFPSSAGPLTLRADDLGNLTLMTATATLVAFSGSLTTGGALTLTLTGPETFTAGQAVFTYRTTSAGGKYLIAHPGLVGILHVDTVDNNDTPSADTLDPFNPTQIMSGAGMFDMVDYAMQQRFREDAQRTFSDEFHWRTEQERDGNFYLYVVAPDDVVNVCYDYKWHCTPDDDATTGIRFIPDSDADWIMDMVLALSKQILGRILRKHGGILNSDGGSDNTDGDSLTSEGRDDEQRLMDQILKRKDAMPPMMG